jgi:hypothetical protein
MATLDPSPVDQAVSQRRVRDPRELYASWLDRDVPMAVAQQLISYATTYGLDLAATSSDLYPLRQHQSAYLMVLRWSGIERICRSSGLWLPGRSRVTRHQDELIIEGSCYLRSARDSERWCEVSELARFGSHHERDYASDDLLGSGPTGEWTLIPEQKLSEVAQYLAAAKALGELVTCHETVFKHPRSLIHRDVIQERRRQQSPPAPALRAQ